MLRWTLKVLGQAFGVDICNVHEHISIKIESNVKQTNKDINWITIQITNIKKPKRKKKIKKISASKWITTMDLWWVFKNTKVTIIQSLPIFPPPWCRKENSYELIWAKYGLTCVHWRLEGVRWRCAQLISTLHHQEIPYEKGTL